MANDMTLTKATQIADRNFRRTIAVMGFGLVFLFVAGLASAVFGAGTLSGGEWVIAILSGAGAMIGYWAAQKDNRDFKSGTAAAIVTSTAKDLGTVALYVLGAATLLAMLGVAAFGTVLAGAVAGLAAQFVFCRIWVPLK